MIPRRAPILLATLAGLTASVLTPAHADVTLDSVTLHRSGVGHFVHRGTINNNEQLSLTFDQDQISDLLKSLVLIDLDGGRTNVVTYASRDPLERRLGSFSVDLANNPGVANILAQLRGSQVRISTADATLDGTVLGVESRSIETSSGASRNAMHVNLFADGRLTSINLDRVISYEIRNSALAAELAEALAAIAEHRDDRSKSVDIAFEGDGERRVFVGYVHEAPVWKTSYRLGLPEGSIGWSDDAVLQGWAIIENTTDQDWDEVTLSLVAGRPIGFTMDLYEPLFLNRPDVAVPVQAAAAPKTYARTTSELEGIVQQKMMYDDADADGSFRGELTAVPADRSRRSLGRVPTSGGRGGGSGGLPMNAESAAAPVASADTIGEVYQFTLDNPVSVPRQRAAMVPIISDTTRARRVSIFNADSDTQPKRGVQLTAGTNARLLPGPLAVYDGDAYAGDAMISHVSPGETILLAHAIDLDTLIETESASQSEIRTVRVVGGRLELTTKRTMTTTYTAAAKHQEGTRTLLIEHTKIPEWDLIEPTAPAEEAEGLYRFELELEPNTAEKLKITLERTMNQVQGFAMATPEQLAVWRRGGKISDQAARAVTEAARLQNLVQQSQARLNELKAEIEAITRDQSRIRDNMARLAPDTDLYRRYVRTLNDQEDQLGKLRDDQAKVTQEINTRQAAFNDYLRNLNID